MQRQSLFKRLLKPLRFRVYRRMLLTYFALALFLVLFVGGALSAVYMRYAVRAFFDSSADLMSQRVYSAQTLWDEMSALASSMSTNANLQRFLTMTQDDKIIRYQASRELANYKISYPFVRNISAVNLTCGAQLSSIYYIDDQPLFSQYAATGAVASVARVIPPPNFRQSELSVLSFVYPIKLYASEITSGFVISIDQAHLHSLLLGEGSAALGTQILILDRAEQVVTRTGDIALPEELRLSLLQKALSAGENRGSSIETIAGARYLTTFCRFPSQEWTVFSFQPVTSLQDQIARTLGLIAAILGAMLLLGLLVATLSSRHAYRPIRTLVGEVSRMDESVPVDEIAAITGTLASMQARSDEMLTSLRQATVRSLLLSEHAAGSPGGAGSTGNGLLGGAAYVVLLLTPAPGAPVTPGAPAAPGAPAVPAAAEAERVCRALEGLCDCDCLSLGNRLAILLSLSSAERSGEVLMALERMDDGTGPAGGGSGTAGGGSGPAGTGTAGGVQLSVSDVVLSEDQLHRAYEQALLISQAGFYAPGAPLLTSAQLAPAGEAPVSPELARELLDALLNADAPAALRVTQELLAQASRHRPAYCREIVGVILSECVDTLWGSLEEEPRALLRARCLAVSEAASFAELTELAGRCVSDCCAALSGSESRRGALHNQRLIRQVCEVIRQRYADPAFSLQDAAGHVQLSPGDLGRLFKQVTGVSFSQHLTSCRLDAARALLADPSMPIAAIAGRVGLENPSYFASLFKKVYGVSPSAYRDNLRGQRPGK